MKRTTAFILTALLLLSLAGCATGTMLNTTGSTPILAVPSSSTIPSTTVPATSIPIPTTAPPSSTTAPQTTTSPTTGTTSTTVSTAPTQRPSRFYGEQLTVYIEGNPYIYIRYAPGTGSLTRKDCLDHFYTTTHIEGISWNVYSTEEYPDLSFILVMSGTNSNWTYRLADVTGFSAYLDTMGFVPGISQRDIRNLEETLVNQGDNANYSGMGCYYDSQYGGGYAAQSEYWGVSNDYKRAEDGTSATSTNRLYTYIPLEGLELPYDITFTSNLSGVLQKIGFSTDPYNNFVSDAGTPGVMTLHNDGKVCLALTDFSQKPNVPENNKSTFNLQYMETYEVTLTDGRIADVTRTFSMSFSGNENTLGHVSMSVQTKYPLNQE